MLFEKSNHKVDTRFSQMIRCCGRRERHRMQINSGRTLLQLGDQRLPDHFEYQIR